MIRSNHYEAAFEAYLRSLGVGFISVDEAKRSLLDGEDVKSVDFVVVGPQTAKLVVDVKGRKYPGGDPAGPRRAWQNWAMHEDVDGLTRWAAQFGAEFRGVLAFVYCIAPNYTFPDDTPDLFVFRDRTYLMRAVGVAEYRRLMRPRSRRWQTVHLRTADFRRVVRPFSCFLGPNTPAAVSGTQEHEISP
jgi:hypothetical protein